MDTADMNSKVRGAIGVARAIAYYAAKGWPVFTPVSDIARYDLIVDSGECLLRVEVKTTTRTDGQFSLRTNGGNQSWNGLVKKIDAADCDLVFLVNLISGSAKEVAASELSGRSSVNFR